MGDRELLSLRHSWNSSKGTSFLNDFVGAHSRLQFFLYCYAR